MYTCVSSAYECPTSPALAMISNNSAVYNRNRSYVGVSSSGAKVFAARGKRRVAAPLVRSAAKIPPFPLEVGPLKSSYGSAVSSTIGV